MFPLLTMMLTARHRSQRRKRRRQKLLLRMLQRRPDVPSELLKSLSDLDCLVILVCDVTRRFWHKYLILNGLLGWTEIRLVRYTMVYSTRYSLLTTVRHALRDTDQLPVPTRTEPSSKSRRRAGQSHSASIVANSARLNRSI